MCVEVITALLIGVLLGLVGAFLINLSFERRLLDRTSSWVIIIPYTIFIVATIHMYNGDGILGVFIAGLVMNMMDINPTREAEQMVTESSDLVALLIFFTFFGSIIPWSSYTTYGIGNLFGFSVIILLFRRVPFIIPLYILNLLPVLKLEGKYPILNPIGLAVYGPVAAAATLYATQIYLETENIVIWHILSFTILVSAVLHGSSSILFSYFMRYMNGGPVVACKEEGEDAQEDSGDKGVKIKALVQRMAKAARNQQEEEEKTSVVGVDNI